MARGAGLAAVEIVLDVGLGERHAGRAAVDHAADGGAVRFAEHGDTEQFAECAARHGISREKAERMPRSLAQARLRAPDAAAR